MVMTTAHLTLTALMALREQLPDEDDLRRVFVDDAIWSVREAMRFEQCGLSVAEWWRQIGRRMGEQRGVSLASGKSNND
jgi:hypothetical protein